MDIIARGMANKNTVSLGLIGTSINQFPRLLGEVDDTARFQRALASTTGIIYIGDISKSYTLSGQIVIDPTKQGIVGNGATITSSYTGGATILIKGTGTHPTMYRPSTVVHLSGFELIGPGELVQGGIGIQYSDDVGSYASYTSVNNLFIHEWYIGITWHNNTWQTKHAGLTMEHCNTCVQYPYDSTSGILTDSGEEITFYQCTFFNSNNGVVNLSGADMQLSGCSFDYIGAKSVQCMGGGTITLDACHLECSYDMDYWLYCGRSSVIVMNGGKIYNAATTKNQYRIGYADTTTYDGGIHLNNVMYGQSNSTVYAFPTIITGVGTSRNLLPYSTTTNTTIQSLDSLNYLIAGGFESGSLSEWTLSAGTNATIDATQAHSGTNSLKLACASGQYTSIYHSVPVVPGSKPRMSFYAKTSFNGSVDQFFIKAIYYDNTGTAINPPTYTQTFSTGGTNPASWTLYFINPYQPAPAGAVTCRFYIQQCNSTTTSDGIGAKMNIDDIIITVE